MLSSQCECGPTIYVSCEKDTIHWSLDLRFTTDDALTCNSPLIMYVCCALTLPSDWPDSIPAQQELRNSLNSILLPESNSMLWPESQTLYFDQRLSWARWILPSCFIGQTCLTCQQPSDVIFPRSLLDEIEQKKTNWEYATIYGFDLEPPCLCTSDLMLHCELVNWVGDWWYITIIVGFEEAHCTSNSVVLLLAELSFAWPPAHNTNAHDSWFPDLWVSTCYVSPKSPDLVVFTCNRCIGNWSDPSLSAVMHLSLIWPITMTANI